MYDEQALESDGYLILSRSLLIYSEQKLQYDRIELEMYLLIRGALAN